MRSLALILVAVFVAVGCQGKIGDSKGGTAGAGGGGGQGGGQDPGPPACYANENDKVRQGLTPTCKGCHDNSNRPFFATAESFEDLLVYEPKYVTPGKPDDSYLVKLLEGMANGAYKQMPLSGDPFVVLDKNGLTSISLKAVRDWIANLPPPGPRGTAPALGSPMTRRLTAEELTLGIRRVLGLPENGLWCAHGVGLLIRASDAPYGPGERDHDFCHPLQPNGSTTAEVRRFEALGGPNMLEYRPRSKDITPAMLQMLVQISQEWCGYAVEPYNLPPNLGLFKYASLTSTSAKDADAIRKNLGYLYLRFLGDTASDSVLDDLYTKVFLTYEPQGESVAWTAVSHLVRDPQFLML